MGRIKLLHKTLRLYILCSAAVLFIAAPVFYGAISKMYIEDVDETLLLHKKEFIQYYLPKFKQAEIESWNRYNRDMKIERLKSLGKIDTIFNATYFDSLDNENEPYRVLYSPVIIENSPYIFSARISLVENEDLVKRIAFVFVLLFVLLLTALTFVTNYISKKVWQPFQHTLESLRLFDLTAKKKVLFEKSNIEEFEVLNHSLEKLIDNNISVFTQQKTFIENASHELQTPLAVLKSKITLLLQNRGITQEQSNILSSIELGISRMSRINKNMLLLSKIENSQFSDIEQVELMNVVSETLNLLGDYIAAKQIEVRNTITQGQALTCNKTLLEILISNLLINSIVHNSEKGILKLSYAENTLTVSNTGTAGLTKENLFNRFAISNPNKTNSGLGLAIVKEICNRYNWCINYEYEHGLHSFSIKF
jgi:signal transduction histidine kinase